MKWIIVVACLYAFTRLVQWHALKMMEKRQDLLDVYFRVLSTKEQDEQFFKDIRYWFFGVFFGR